MKLTKELVKEFASKNGKFKTSDLVSYLRNTVTRQYVSSYLRKMVESGSIVRAGSTKNVFYALPENIDVLGTSISERFENKDLKEHEVMEKLRAIFPSLYTAPENVRSIFGYGFTEMLNNAIEHSQSPYITIEASKSDDRLSFSVKDSGIGVFNSVMQKRHLSSALEAVQDLLKGKTTTRPEAHSGEGIFFTSKVADVFILESGHTRLRIDNQIPDVFVEELDRVVNGTNVSFTISPHSKKHLIQAFEGYQTDPSTFAFDKTEVKVRLYTMGTIYVSRSQARRILAGLEKFKSVILDFDRVPTIGQAFADEIFRIFKKTHPDIKITPINMVESVKFMVERVEAP